MREIGLGMALPVRADVVAGGRIIGNNGDRGRWRILGHALTRQRRVGVALPVVALVEGHVVRAVKPRPVVPRPLKITITSSLGTFITRSPSESARPVESESGEFQETPEGPTL